MEILKKASLNARDLQGLNNNGFDMKNALEKINKGALTSFELDDDNRVDYEHYMDELVNFLNYKENNSEIVIDSYIMIKLFYISKVNETKTSIILTTEMKRDFSNYKVFPIGIVINKGKSTVFENGDLVSIPLNMTKTILSKDYVEYRSKLASQPSLSKEIPAPPMYIGRLNEWVSYMYQEDPFIETTIEDQHTFCLPDRFIQTKIDKDQVIQMLYRHIEENKTESNENNELES